MEQGRAGTATASRAEGWTRFQGFRGPEGRGPGVAKGAGTRQGRRSGNRPDSDQTGVTATSIHQRRINPPAILILIKVTD